jgi:hypothetical protein
MPKSQVLEQKDFARNALIQATSKSMVGNFIEVVDEGEGIATYLFENNQKGYVGWRWSITVFQLDASSPVTVSEVLLMPGPDSLVAPDWVPWSERLADYKALQIELEKQAALDALESDEEVDDDEDIEEDVEVEEELAVSDLEEGEDAKDDAEDTGRKPPRFLRRRKGFKIKKARGKGKDPQD